MGLCEAVRGELALLALGDPTARLTPAVAEHLGQCVGCRREYAELFEAAALLPLAVPRVEPPPALRERVLAALEEVPRAAQAADGRAPALHPKAAPFGADDRATQRPRAPLVRLSLGWVAAASILLGMTGVFGAWWGSAHERAEWHERAARTEGRLIELAEMMVGGQSVRLAELAVSGTEAAPHVTGRAVLYRTPTEVYLVLYVRNLPPTEGRQAYQTWLLRDGRRLDAGTFRVGPDGEGVLVYSATTDLAFDALGITLEPDDVGHAPRGPKMAGGEMAQPPEA